MKPGKSGDNLREEVVEVHAAARSPSPKQRNKDRPRSRSTARKLSNGHLEKEDTEPVNGETDKSKLRERWANSEQESVDAEIPIHDQIKMGILGFVEKEIKKSDKNPSFVFYSHDPNGLEEKFMRTLSRPSSGHKEKRSPSYRKKKRHSSRHRDRELHDFEIPGSSLIALEKVDDYLKEYNKDEVVTLSGEIEIEGNDMENNNGIPKELRHKSRKTRRKIRDEKQDMNSNGRDVSPKVFKTGSKIKSSKSARPSDISVMLESLERTSVPYHDEYIDNPFSSPSPLTTPSDDRLDPFSARHEKIFLQGGGTFRSITRDKMLEKQHTIEGDKYLRLGDLTPVDVAFTVQKAWRNFAPACHGVLGGLSLMHLLLISYSDSLDAGHLSFHGVITMPYVATYYFFCVLCLLSVLDRLDITMVDLSRGIQPWFQPMVLVVLYTACLLVSAAARMYDELMVYQYAPLVSNVTANITIPTIPTFYHTWTHFSIWRAVLSILGLVYFVISNPQDLVYLNLSKLLHYKHPLQSIG